METTVDKIKNMIRSVFNDTSKTQKDTLADLKDIREDLDEYINCIEEKLEAEELEEDED